MAIKQEANRLKMKYQTTDPYDICTSMDIQVIKRPMGANAQSCKGFFLVSSRCKLIVINSDLPESIQRIIIAHELGHAVLHTEVALMRGFQEMEVLESRQDMPEENEANLFAAELLLEDEAVLEHLSEESFFEAARSLYVPAALLDYKFLLLRSKGYSLNTMDVRKSDFLKEDLGAYEDSDRFHDGC